MADGRYPPSLDVIKLSYGELNWENAVLGQVWSNSDEDSYNISALVKKGE